MNNRKRWVYLGIGTLLLLCCGLIYGWSLFKTPFSEIYSEWSLADLSMTFTISMISFCLGSFVAGKLSEKFSSKTIIMISAVLILTGFFGVSRMDPENAQSSLLMLYMCYGVLGGLGSGFTYNNVISTVNKWFPDMQGFSSGIMLMGFGLGGLVFGSVAATLIKVQGIFNAFFTLGIITFFTLMVGAFLIKPPQAKASNLSQETLRGDRPLQMVKTGPFWIFAVWCIIANSAGLMIISIAAPIAMAFGAPAIVGMIVSIFNGAGRVIIGGVFDRIGRKKTMLINTSILMTAGIMLLLGAKTSSMIFILIGLLGMGMSYGGNPTITSAFINKQYGAKYFAVNFSLANFSAIPAAIIGPTLSSNLIASSNGSYSSSFIAIIVFAVLGFILWLLLNRQCRDGEKD